MKKTMILAAFAALVSLASCQKEDVIDNKGTDKNASPVFTASIAGATKTTIDLTNGKVAWEESDEITITDALSKSAVYKIESIDATTGKATFAIKSGETALGDGPYTATYGTVPATAQTYSATAGKLYMTAATEDNIFTFDVQCGLMKLNLTSPDESVKSIAVSNSTATYTLTCDPAQSIATAKDFFIALPAGSYTKIEITNAEDVTCTLNSTNGVAVAANHIKPVTFGEDKLNFVLNIPEGALKGKFTINSAGDQVYFSQGNLYYDGREFQFEANQYDFPTTVSASHAGHFSWSNSAELSIAKGFDWDLCSIDDIFFTNATETTAKPDFTVNGVTGQYRTLSNDEWMYLLNTRTVNGGTGKDKTYSHKITYGGKVGVVLYPDNYAGAVLYETVETLPQGVVFLPAAGSSGESAIYYIENGVGGYWSSSPHSENEWNAYAMEFTNNNTEFGCYVDRYDAISIRLVTDVK